MKAMSTSIVAFLFLPPALLTPTAVAVAQPPGSDPPSAGANVLSKEDDRAVRKTIASVEEAWNAHDMKAMGRLFTEDAEFINVVGMLWRGRDDIVTAHAAFHRTSFKNHSLKTDSIETRSLGGGQAIAVVTTTNDSFITPDGQVVPKRQNRQTYVLTKGPEGWRIAHGHNVPVDAEAAKHDPTKRPGQ
jgi:uncharacterized protein (TIGR02246 family)